MKSNQRERQDTVASGHEPPAIITEGMPTQLPDIDPDETREWVE